MDPVVNLAMIVTPRSGPDLVFGYSDPGRYGGRHKTARNVPWAAHREAVGFAFEKLNENRLDAREAYFGVCEFVGDEAAGYYREVVTLDYEEALECLRTNGRSVGTLIQALDRAAKAAADPVKEDAAAAKLLKDLKVEPRDLTVSADSLTDPEPTVVDLERVESDEGHVPLETDITAAFSFPEKVKSYPAFSLTDVVLTMLGLGLPAPGKCGNPRCKACYPTAGTVSADSRTPNGVGRG